MLEAKIVQFSFVKSEEQLADVLTKVVSSKVFYSSLNKLGIEEIQGSVGVSYCRRFEGAIIGISHLRLPLIKQSQLYSCMKIITSNKQVGNRRYPCTEQSAGVSYRRRYEGGIVGENLQEFSIFFDYH